MRGIYFCDCIDIMLPTLTTQATKKQVQKIVILMTELFGKERKNILNYAFWLESTKDFWFDFAMQLIDDLENGKAEEIKMKALEWELKILLSESDSVDDWERNSWIDIFPTMNIKHKERLRDILLKEKIELWKIET